MWEKMEGVCLNGPERRIISMAEAASMYPGFKFSPSDAELISYYLTKKLEGLDKSVEQLIPEVDFSAHEPWDLPAKSIIPSESEWFFFSVRGRKYPKGSQSKRATEHGYWKATGKERNVKSSSVMIGTKRTLVYHLGRAPKGKRTEWIMHEYSMNAKSQICDGDEDFYADILKDDIVKLDESSISSICNTLPTVPITLEAELMSQDLQNQVQDFMSPQGTANRRIRLRRQKTERSSRIVVEIKAGDYSAENAEPRTGSSRPSERKTSVIIGWWIVYGVLAYCLVLFICLVIFMESR